jgi:predicted GNAT family acetyltransferase
VTEGRVPGGREVVHLLLRDRAPLGVGGGGTHVRRLVRSDRPGIEAWGRRRADPTVAELSRSDPGAEWVWGAFEGDDLVGVAAASARLPLVWMIGGVYVDPVARHRGVGRALVSEVVRAAEAAGAPTGLYVRESSADARALYERLGFRSVGRRIWLEFGGAGALG